MKSLIWHKNGFPRPPGLLVILLIIGILSLPVSLFAQGQDKNPNPVERNTNVIPTLFEEEMVLNLTIATNLTMLTGDMGSEPEYHKAILCYSSPGYDTVSFHIKIKARGNFRNKKSNCDFPPLCINFDRDEVHNTLFDGQNKIKLVTHCRNCNPDYEQLLFKEYLVYRLYNALTPYSLKVRLAKVTYIDIQEPGNAINAYAFMMETPDQMAARNGGECVKEDNLSPEDLDPRHFTLLSLFQYMIINNDWSVPLMKNIHLISTGDSLPLIPVPFDFDFAGFVNAPYRLTEDPSKDVFSDRRYYGPPMNYSELENFSDLFRSMRKELYELVRSFEPLDRDQKMVASKMLNDFFRVLDQPEKDNSGFLAIQAQDTDLSGSK